MKMNCDTPSYNISAQETYGRIALVKEQIKENALQVQWRLNSYLPKIVPL